MSREHGTQRAAGRLWKERERREREERARREESQGKRARKGADFAKPRALQALGIQVRPVQCSGATGPAATGSSRHGSFYVGCLRTTSKQTE